MGCLMYELKIFVLLTTNMLMHYFTQRAQVNIDDLQSFTEYHQYKASDPQILWFWEVVRGLDREQRAAFLQFVTGTSKVGTKLAFDTIILRTSTINALVTFNNMLI